jgi:hypothetical protein
MHEQLRQHVSATFAPVEAATLATHGPAGLLADVVPCRAVGTRLYLQVPCTSDHLVNLETGAPAVATTCGWQARGRARVMRADERPAGLIFAGATEARWNEVVELVPTRVDIAQTSGWGAAETIELE